MLANQRKLLRGLKARAGIEPARQIALKRRRVKSERFEALDNQQQGGVKQVIRNTARQARKMIGPQQDEPAAAMSDAAEATFGRARPLYRVLDRSLIKVPDQLDKVTGILKEAIGRPQKLGVDIAGDPEISGEVSVDKQGNLVDPRDMSPAKWQDAVDAGDIVKKRAIQGQPLNVYMKIRSQLLRMQRASADPAVRYAVGNEIARISAQGDEPRAEVEGRQSTVVAGLCFARGGQRDSRRHQRNTGIRAGSGSESGSHQAARRISGGQAEPIGRERNAGQCLHSRTGPIREDWVMPFPGPRVRYTVPVPGRR